MRLIHRGGYTALNQGAGGLDKQKNPRCYPGTFARGSQAGGGDALEPRTSAQR
jgi:hypothetical protein